MAGSDRTNVDEHETERKEIMRNASNLLIRIFFYLFGFLIMTMGIAISIKSNLGVSPVSSIPYTMTCIWGVEIGLATALFNSSLVLIQLLILRKNFEVKNLLQIPVCILFGAFTSFSNGLMAYFPDPSSMMIRIIMILFSTTIIAIGLFLYVPANFIPLAGEGTMLAISKVTKIKFSTVKVLFDISVVAISLVTCLLLIRKMGSVGIGTIIAAVLVGMELKIITKWFGATRDRILQYGKQVEATKAIC